MKLRYHLSFACLLALMSSVACAENITSARYTNPVDRYGHFALGKPHEYARLVVSTDTGRSLALQLPEDEVFEDLAPQAVKLEAGGSTEILAIVSHRDRGARLVMVSLNGNRLEICAQSQAIGTPNRWLNPVGVADLDGDGRAEISAVITPHIGGTLKVYQRRGGDLVEIAALADFSNHAYGSPELGLSTPALIAGRMRLLVPDATRMDIRVIALENGNLIETARCALPAPITGAMYPISPTGISVGLHSGRRVIALSDCPGSSENRN